MNGTRNPLSIMPEPNVRVRILTSFSIPQPGIGAFRPGEVVSVPSDRAEEWIRLGTAVRADMTIEEMEFAIARNRKAVQNDVDTSHHYRPRR